MKHEGRQAKRATDPTQKRACDNWPHVRGVLLVRVWPWLQRGRRHWRDAAVVAAPARVAVAVRKDDAVVLRLVRDVDTGRVDLLAHTVLRAVVVCFDARTENVIAPAGSTCDTGSDLACKVMSPSAQWSATATCGGTNSSLCSPSPRLIEAGRHISRRTRMICVTVEALAMVVAPVNVGVVLWAAQQTACGPSPPCVAAAAVAGADAVIVARAMATLRLTGHILFTWDGGDGGARHRRMDGSELARRSQKAVITVERDTQRLSWYDARARLSGSEGLSPRMQTAE